MDQNFANSSCKGSPKEHSCEIISKSDQRFQRKKIKNFLESVNSASSPHSPDQCLGTDQNFTNKFSIGSPKEDFCETISQSDQWFQSRRFFKNPLCP